MRFSSIIASFVSLAAIAAPLVTAQGTETNENIIVMPAAGDTWTAGIPFEIKWTASANPGTVTIILLKGLQTNLQVVETIAPAITNNGKFMWTPPVTLEGMQTMPADHIYGFKIVNDITGNFGWSPPFKLSSPQSTFGTGAATTTGVSSTATAASTASTATTASSVSTAVSTSESSSSTPTTATESSSSTISAASTSSSISSRSSAVSSSASTSSASATTSASKTESTSSSASETAALATETESESASPSATPEAGQKLSNIAIAGISVGAVALIIVGIAAFLLVRRRKRNSRQRLVGNAPNSGKYEDQFQMMERRARNRTSSFGFNNPRDSGGEGMLSDRSDPYMTLDGGNGALGKRSTSGSWGRLENVRF